MVELSFDPAIHRTFAAVTFMGLLQQEVPAEAKSWIEWNQGALKAAQRIASKCWTGVASDFRTAFLDLDDLPPVASHSYISGLRQNQPGLAASRFAGLNMDAVRDALTRMYGEIKSTETAVIARSAASLLERKPAYFADLMSVRGRTQKRLQDHPTDATIAEVHDYMREVVEQAYSTFPHLEDIVASFRNHNKFVQQILWAILGTAEATVDVSIHATMGAIIEEVVDGERQISFTVEQGEAALLRPTRPVWVELGTPLDGLYWVKHHTFAFASGQQDDLTLVAYS
jgi:hypothetical protein